MDPQQNELVRLLASFKLTVKRHMQKSVDLEAMANNPGYAHQCLAEVEDAADSEEILVMVLKLRQLLMPSPMPQVAPVQAKVEEEPAKETRNYKFGARSW